MSSAASVKLAACTSCSYRHDSSTSFVMRNSATKATLAFCGEECAHKHFGTKPTGAAAATTTPAKTSKVGNSRSETRTLLDSQAKAMEEAERIAKQAEASPDDDYQSDGYSSDGSASSRSGYSSDSSTGSNSSSGRRRKSRKGSKKRAVMRGLKVTMVKTLEGMLIVANKLLELTADNLSAENIKKAVNIIMKGVKLAAKILPMILPLLPLLILSKQGDKQSVPDYLKQKLREVVSMIRAVIAGIKSARLTSNEFYQMQAIIKSTASDLSEFISKKKMQFMEGASASAAAAVASAAPATGESQQQLQLQGKQTKTASAAAAEGYTWDKNNSQRPTYNDNNLQR